MAENFQLVARTGHPSFLDLPWSEPLDAILITRHLDYSLPYRALFAGGAIPDLRSHLLNALVELLARLHLRGFFWGDCSLSDGLRGYDLELAETNVVGELLDVDAEVGLTSDVDPEETGAEVVRSY